MFDWSGTLVDEYELDKSICKNIEYEIAIKERISLKEANQKYTDLLKKYENSWEWYNYPLHGDIFDIDWKRAQTSELFKIKLIPNVVDIMAYYKDKGYYIFLITNAVRAVIEPRLDYLKIRKFFNLIITSDMVKSTKATGKHFEHALKHIDHSEINAYMIGDSLSQDLFPAKRFGIITILCKFGDVTYSHTNNSNSNIESLASFPDYTINSIKEILKIVK